MDDKKKYIVKTMPAPQEKPEVKDIPISEISVQRLIDDGLLILYRETRHLLTASARGKLDAPSARDLRDNLKLLFELKDREGESLKGLTDEEMKALAEAAINGPTNDK